jgi:hypothetical protein
MTLRAAVLGVFCMVALAGLFAGLAGRCPGWVPVALWALPGIVVLLFERGRYRPQVPREAEWHRTGERFIDPSSGERFQVFFEPETGNRDYRRLG